MSKCIRTSSKKKVVILSHALKTVVKVINWPLLLETLKDFIRKSNFKVSVFLALLWPGDQTVFLWRQHNILSRKVQIGETHLERSSKKQMGEHFIEHFVGSWLSYLDPWPEINELHKLELELFPDSKMS